MLNIGHLPAGRAVSILAGYRTPDPTDWREEGRDMAAREMEEAISQAEASDRAKS